MRRWWSAVRRLVPGRPQALQRRLTLLTMAAVAVTLVATCVTGWVALQVTLFDISERGSLLIARDLAPLASRSLTATGRLDARVLGPGSTVVQVVGADGTVQSTPGEDVTLEVGQSEVAAAQEQQQIVRNTTSSTGETYRIVTVPLGRFDTADTAARSSRAGEVLVVGRPLTSSYEVLNVFGLVVLVVGAVGLGWAWLIGRTVATAALVPVRRFTEAVRHVADTEDLHPVSAGTYTGGDLATLTTTFNQMLARLAQSRDQQDRLIADASHELRTPLTSMRTNVELLALDARRRRLTDASRTKILDDVLAQTVELSTLIADLVHLSREHTGNVRGPVEVRHVVETALRRVRRRSPDLTFAVDLDLLTVHGDPGSLEQAVTNLLDNAVKWSPPGTTVHVDLHGEQLRIADEGPGVAEVDLPHIFDRFYRAETARSTPGTGLGLAIAAKTVRDHGGTIEAAQSAYGGAEFTIQLPEILSPTSPTIAETSTPVDAEVPAQNAAGLLDADTFPGGRTRRGRPSLVPPGDWFWTR